MLSGVWSAAPQGKTHDETALTSDRHRTSAFHSFASLAGRALGLPVIVIGIVAITVPFLVHGSGAFILGLLIFATAGLQVAHAYTLPKHRVGRSRFAGTGTSIITGLLLVAASELVFRALAFLLGLSWIVDGLVKIRRAISEDVASRTSFLFDGTINLILGLAIAIQWPFAGAWTVFIAVGFRIISAGWAMLMGRRKDAAAGESAAPEAKTDPLREAVAQEESLLAPAHAGWIVTLLLVFFAIHVGRMEAHFTPVSLFSPIVAVIGDVFFAMVICYVIVVPARVAAGLVLMTLARKLAEVPHGSSRLRRTAAWMSVKWLRWQTRFSLRLEQASRSPAAGVRLGLLTGLPPTAVLVAIAPLLGISWYFNTETWATGAWDHWAAHRTDTWREEMTVAIRKDAQARGLAEEKIFQVDPGVIGENEDFSFIVIGDTGEGDASQHVLRDQFLALGKRPVVKFLIVSSDVIYPQGAMKDYEPKFYLPFKGFGKPIFAIPGNHDWYDALEAFNANLLEPHHARIALLARREADHKLTTTTEAKIDLMLQQAATLRREYGVQSACQPAPFFEIQTPRFAMLAVDTGILRTIDDEQMKWVRAALERSRGKFVMVLAGHPLYAAGHYVPWDEDDPYRQFHQLCREYDVRLFMAGDTHDLEMYRETYSNREENRSMLHIVNGGGGAYLSIGTALTFPDRPAFSDCAFYPRKDAIIEKLNAETPALKWPLWWWTRKFDAWPSTPETLASAFASNLAPFYQSFCEIRVEPSKGQVRVIPHGPNGQLSWRDLQRFGNEMQHADDEPAEWKLAFPPR